MINIFTSVSPLIGPLTAQLQTQTKFRSPGAQGHLPVSAAVCRTPVCEWMYRPDLKTTPYRIPTSRGILKKFKAPLIAEPDAGDVVNDSFISGHPATDGESGF